MPPSFAQNYSFRRPSNPPSRRESTTSVPISKDSAKSLGEIAQEVKKQAEDARRFSIHSTGNDVTGKMVKIRVDKELAALKKAHAKELETQRKAHQVEVNNIEAIAVKNSIDFVKAHSSKICSALTREHAKIISQFKGYKERT